MSQPREPGPRPKRMRRVKAQKTNPEQSVEELLTAEFLAMMEEHGPPVHVTGANATLKHLRNVAITLEKGNVDWEKKSAALREIRQLLDKHREEFCQAWPKCHRIVCPAIVSVLKSLRCAVQKEACVTIAFLCVNMTNSHGGGFTVGAELVIDQILTLIASKNVVTSQYASVCAEFIVQNIKTLHVFNAIAKGADHKSADIRLSAQRLMGLVLESWSSNFLGTRGVLVSNFIRRGIRDAARSVRNTARHNYFSFCRRYPSEPVRLLYSSLEVNYRRLISESSSDLQVTLPRPSEVKECPTPAPETTAGSDSDTTPGPSLPSSRSSSIEEVGTNPVEMIEEQVVEEQFAETLEKVEQENICDQPAVPEAKERQLEQAEKTNEEKAHASSDQVPCQLLSTLGTICITPADLCQFLATKGVVPQALTFNSQVQFLVLPVEAVKLDAAASGNHVCTGQVFRPVSGWPTPTGKIVLETEAPAENAGTPRVGGERILEDPSTTTRFRSGMDAFQAMVAFEIMQSRKRDFSKETFEWRLRPFLTTYGRSGEPMEEKLKSAITALRTDKWKVQVQGLLMLRKCLEVNRELTEDQLDDICDSISYILKSKTMMTAGTQLIHLFDMIECLVFLHVDDIEDWLATLPLTLLRAVNSGVNRWVEIRFVHLFSLVSEAFVPSESFGLFLDALDRVHPDSPGALTALKVLARLSNETSYEEVKEHRNFDVLRQFAEYPGSNKRNFYTRLILNTLRKTGPIFL